MCCNPLKRMPLPPRDRVDLSFRAFADPVRMRLLNILVSGEVCVCDLMTIVELPQATVSRHLSYLRRAGLVDVRRDGSWNYYALSSKRTELHRKLLDCLGLCFSDVPQLKADLVRAAKVRKAGGCC